MKRLHRVLGLALCLAFVSIGVAYAVSQFSFINSNNGAALNSGSNKTNCLRGHMMSVNGSPSNPANAQWDCTADVCYQHGSTSIVKGRIYGPCKDLAGGDRLCKIDGPWNTWRSVVYNQSAAGCTAYGQSCFTSNGTNCGAALTGLTYSNHFLTVW